VLLFIAVLGANSVLSYAYTKDVIMSPAGGFYALAVCAATRSLLQAREVAMPAVAVAGALALSVTWAVRDVGAHANLRQFAYSVRNEWAYVDEWVQEHQKDLSGPDGMALLRDLRTSAIRTHPAPPPLLPSADWVSIFEIK
jgi:hypothetical protein